MNLCIICDCTFEPFDCAMLNILVDNDAGENNNAKRIVKECVDPSAFGSYTQIQIIFFNIFHYYIKFL